MLIEIIFFSLTIFVILKLFKKPSDYPPGPWGYPIIGRIPSGRKEFMKEIIQLKEQHGDVFSWKMGSRFLVFISDFKLVKELFSSQTFAERPNLSTLSFAEDKSIGILSSNGHHWQEIRHFSLRHLRDLGMGKSKLVSAIHYEASELIKEIKKLAGKPGPFPEALNPAVINILWQIVASKRFDYENQEFISFGKLLDEWMDAISSNLILDIFPWLKTTLPTFLLNIISKQYVLDKVDRKLTKHFQKCVEEHKESFDKNNPRDYIDEYLIEMMKPKSNSDSSMSDGDLLGCVIDLFGAGLKTTTVTIIWASFYLCNFPEVQTRLHKEIDDVIPDGHLVTLEDKPRLPYVEAFVYEVLRFSTFSPVAVPRTSNHDVRIKNYLIPKGAMVFATAEDIHFDPKYFDSPKEFRPERFINSEGKFEVPKNGFLPFGIGKRLCLGESLARMELFIFLTTLLQHFSFSAPLGKQIDISPLDIPLFNIPKFEQEILIINRK
ncbi:UNVERIFIED_CONTAM: hypothetical protein RMT77_018800 [Armadillidium vulgare]